MSNTGMQDKPQTYEQMHEFARTNGLDETKRMLREYVMNGEPEDFMPGFTSRAMCRAAGAGLDGTPVESVPSSYMDTRFGPELYWAMWGG